MTTKRRDRRSLNYLPMQRTTDDELDQVGSELHNLDNPVCPWCCQNVPRAARRLENWTRCPQCLEWFWTAVREVVQQCYATSRHGPVFGTTDGEVSP